MTTATVEWIAAAPWKGTKRTLIYCVMDRPNGYKVDPLIEGDNKDIKIMRVTMGCIILKDVGLL